MHCYPRFEVRKHNCFRSSAKFPGDEGKDKTSILDSALFPL